MNINTVSNSRSLPQVLFRRLLFATLTAVALWAMPATLCAQIYVTNGFIGDPNGAGTVGKYSSSGATVNAAFITGLSGPEGIGLSGTDLFVVNDNINTIGKYTTSGATVNPALVTGLNGPTGLRAPGTNLYVGNAGGGTIGKYTTSGATVNASLVSGLSGPSDMAIAGGIIYVTNIGNGRVGKYNATTGATINSSLITGLAAPWGITISGGNLFVVKGDNTVGEYTTSGATVNANLITGLSAPLGIKAVGTHLLIVENGRNRIGEYTTSGATVSAALITGLHNPTDLTVEPFALIAAVSRKMHIAGSFFDIDLPLSGEPGVECRSGGGDRAYTLVFTFNNDVVSGNATVTEGTVTGQGSIIFSGPDMIVNLAGVSDVQKVTLTLSNVTDVFDEVFPDVAVSVNMLIGDTNGNKTVNASDVAQTKSQAGRPLTNANFREDVNVSGSISAADISLTKSRVGFSVP